MNKFLSNGLRNIEGETLEYSLDFDKIKCISRSIKAWVINNTKMKNVKAQYGFCSLSLEDIVSVL